MKNHHGRQHNPKQRTFLKAEGPPVNSKENVTSGQNETSRYYHDQSVLEDKHVRNKLDIQSQLESKRHSSKKNNLLIELILIFQEPLIMIIVEDKMQSLPQENVYRLYRQRIMLNSKEGKETLPKKDCMLVQTETSQVVVCIQRHLIYMRETMNNQP
ncbi:hypothetical protein DPMN_141766 [Dreissena polymorpha]|uniref:Uncharacterized protein n=1 Tax=Dreissena polymorpha TaxID=45954 RepID=A0A9D4GDA1_DREPO|nr:hypothetical protein DPMN_141766 [Dreissena polymorpha]